MTRTRKWVSGTVVLALVVRLFDLAGASGVRVNNMAVDGPADFCVMRFSGVEQLDEMRVHLEGGVNE